MEWLSNAMKSPFSFVLRPTARPVYASKDYVEHLRTVHFALLSVSAGVLLLVFTAKSYDSRKAAIQMQEILRLKKVWSPEGIRAPLMAGMGLHSLLPGREPEVQI